MELIPTTPPVLPSAAIQIAESEIKRINDLLNDRVATHRERYLAFWENPSATPDEILAALGAQAQLWLGAATESIAHLARLAALAGRTLDDLMAPEYYVPRRGFILGPDGSATLEPAPIAEPAPAPDPVFSGALSTGTVSPDGTLTLGNP